MYHDGSTVTEVFLEAFRMGYRGRSQLLAVGCGLWSRTVEGSDEISVILLSSGEKKTNKNKTAGVGGGGEVAQ